MIKKNFIVDILLNILSTAVPLLILQLFSLPIIANVVGDEKFGEVVVLISLFTLLSMPIGSVLSNLRLIKNNEYISDKIMGDFNYLFSRGIVVSAAVILYLYFFIDEINKNNLFLLIAITSLLICKEFLMVEYRININYRNILINNSLLSLGYLIGTIIFYYYNVWEVIYLTGLLFSSIHLLNTTRILKESYKKTEKFSQTFKDFLLLYLSGAMKGILGYGDKILLLPLLGATNVAIYYAASVMGKLILIVFNPINNVILSYLVKGSKINKITFIKAFCSILFFSVISYFIVLFVAPLFLNHFYPELAIKSIEILHITSAASVVSLLSIIFHPFNLRFNSFKWQLYMNGSNLVLYLVMALIFTDKMGLYGFCLSGLISSIYKFVFQLSIYISTYFNK